MTDIVVNVENLSKRYSVGHQSAQRESYATLRDTIGREARNFMRKAADFARGREIIQGDEVEDFWALRGLNFGVRRGEVVGVIGRNGAGKSTLLKILSRITEPTEGRVQIRGRITSLLEVGTGFHPELTGRENIFLNGAILGMTRSDIRQKFDEIVTFAGTERFLDVPIKRYSSGMYVRLAFALAAHMDPDILIVDEVLAVGDYEFQQKCLGKMHDVASKEGRTVFLASHQLAAISEMASRAILLDSGRIVVDGDVSHAISTYLSKGGTAPIYVCPREKCLRSPHIERIEVFTSDPSGIHQFGKPLEMKFRIRHVEPLSQACFSFQIINQFQQPVIQCRSFPPELRFGAHSGESILACRFPSPRLNVGTFYLRTWLSEPPGGELYETVDGVCPFEIARFDEMPLWPWRPDHCAYHEEYAWSLVDNKVLVERGL